MTESWRDLMMEIALAFRARRRELFAEWLGALAEDDGDSMAETAQYIEDANDAQDEIAGDWVAPVMRGLDEMVTGESGKVQ